MRLTVQPNQLDQSSTPPSPAGNSSSSSSSSSINHFSHPHPLQLLHNSSQLCSGCKLDQDSAGMMMYGCTMCNFFLHKKCSQMPQQITHPFDEQNHVLTLNPKPIYPEGIFSCDACGKQGDGFSYHCKVCGIDLHILCASSPMNFTHQFHHHQLRLTFSSPYPGNTFSCDLCGINGCNVWLYRCDVCQFDVHLNCVNKQLPAQQLGVMRSRSNPHPLPHNITPANNFPSGLNSQHHLFTQRSMPNNFVSHGGMGMGMGMGIGQGQHQVLGTPFVAAATPMANYGVPIANNFAEAGAFGVGAGGNARGGNGIVNQLVGGVANGIASGASQAIAGALIQGLIGGGDGGNSG